MHDITRADLHLAEEPCQSRVVEAALLEGFFGGQQGTPLSEGGEGVRFQKATGKGSFPGKCAKPPSGGFGEGALWGGRREFFRRSRVLLPGQPPEQPCRSRGMGALLCLPPRPAPGAVPPIYIYMLSHIFTGWTDGRCRNWNGSERTGLLSSL